jgi:hypothetical protein
VSLSDYPFDKYPTFINAGAYLLSMEVLLDFHIAMMYTKLYIYDDVFLSIVAKKLGILPVHLKSMSADVRSTNNTNVLAIHKPDHYDKLWSSVKLEL